VSRIRYTIAQLMAVVIFIAFGFGALRNANEYWASASFGLAIVAVSVGLAGACSRKEGARMPWAAFGIAGGLSLWTWVSATAANGPAGKPPSPLFEMLQSYMTPATNVVAYIQVSYSLDAVLLGCLGAIIGRIFAPKGDRPSP
jgi:hypothetical protein